MNNNLKKIIIAVFILLSFNLVKAQVFIHEFGKYSNEEFQMKSYSRDPNAEAVVIYDIGKSYFVVNSKDQLELIFERQTKIKILNKAGIKWASFVIPYYEEDFKVEYVNNIEGNTYNFENGSVRSTPLDTKTIYTEKTSKNWKNKKLAMPDVKEGSVVELKYTITSPYFFSFRGWAFQSYIPTIYSEYTTKMIPFYTYQYILQGISKLTELRNYIEPGLGSSLGGARWKDMIYVFVLKDVPAFNDEAFISSPNDYIIKLDFQLSEYSDLYGNKTAVMTTWNKLVKDVLDEETFGGYMKNCQNQAKNFLDTMNLTALSTKEKAEKIFDFVKLNYNWNGTNSKFSNQRTKEFLKGKIGNSADINLFLLGMLRAAGIEANPLIISTRGNGKIKSTYPFQHFFNYVLATISIDSTLFALDATEPLCTFGMVPPRCINDDGLLVKKGKDVGWIDISSTMESKIEYNLEISPKSDVDSVYSKINILSTGYDALNQRKKYFKSPSDLKSNLISNNLTLLDSLQTINLSNIKKPFEITFNVSASIDNVDGKLIISPFFGFPITDNPLKQITRVYPIDMTYQNQRKFLSTIKIPEGYKLLSKPQILNINNSNIRLSYNISENEDKTILVEGSYEFKKDIYPANTFADLKFYFKNIIEKFNEKIILVKIE